MLACNAPEVLIGAIADATESIRVGSGGVMLPHYSPLKVAETFSMLSGLHPGRIDLGLGRAPGTDQLTMLALQRDRRQIAADDFREHLAELLGYLDGELPADHPFARLAKLMPGSPAPPRAVAAGLEPAERGLGRRARPALLVRRLHQPAGARHRRGLPPPRRDAGVHRRRRGVRRDRRGGRAAVAVSTGWPSRCCARAG